MYLGPTASLVPCLPMNSASLKLKGTVAICSRNVSVFLDAQGIPAQSRVLGKRGPYQKRINLPHERPAKRLKSESVPPEG